jgi:hypothetical protein
MIINIKLRFKHFFSCTIGLQEENPLKKNLNLEENLFETENLSSLLYILVYFFPYGQAKAILHKVQRTEMPAKLWRHWMRVSAHWFVLPSCAVCSDWLSVIKHHLVAQLCDLMWSYIVDKPGLRQTKLFIETLLLSVNFVSLRIRNKFYCIYAYKDNHDIWRTYR